MARARLTPIQPMPHGERLQLGHRPIARIVAHPSENFVGPYHDFEAKAPGRFVKALPSPDFASAPLPAPPPPPYIPIKAA